MLQQAEQMRMSQADDNVRFTLSQGILCEPRTRGLLFRGSPPATTRGYHVISFAICFAHQVHCLLVGPLRLLVLLERKQGLPLAEPTLGR